ncbi:MAG: translational GTPase TypA [Planctomycetota bacterium]
MRVDTLRNVAIIAHVDHGKTTLVDQMLYQSGMFRREDLSKLAGGQHGLIMDSNPLERERGITILSKNCAVRYCTLDGEDLRINIIDTPGHADFGGEVERVLKMADGVMLLVDAFEGPMPQTRFVLGKALACGLKPIVVVNKCDRPDARPDDVVNEVFDLLVELDAPDEALDFPILYASARDGWASTNWARPGENIRDVFEAIAHHVPGPEVQPDSPAQMLVTTLEYSDYVGRIAVGRLFAGQLAAGQNVTVIDRAGNATRQKILELHQFEGLGKRQVQQVSAGNLCAVVGLDPIDIGNTIACPDQPEALPIIQVDEPTLDMTFRVNDGPFAGREGSYVTSRQIAARLQRELQSNVALRVADGQTPEEFRVSGRGLMHLGILLENMRREGFELTVGKPEVIYKEIDGKTCEPVERLVVDCPSQCQSSVMALVGERRAEIVSMDAKVGAAGFVHMEFTIPARGLVGLRSRMLTATQGQAIMHHTLAGYQRVKGEVPRRQAGVIVATHTGAVTSYALDSLYDRGVFFVGPGDEVYEGQIVGEHCKEDDIGANVTKTKNLTNIRSSTKEEGVKVRPARELSLEAALEYIEDDELVEITPHSVRLRKRMLKESDRRRESRKRKK